MFNCKIVLIERDDFCHSSEESRVDIFGPAPTSKDLGNGSFPLLHEKGDDVGARHWMRCVAVCRECSCPSTGKKKGKKKKENPITQHFTSPLTQQTAKAKPQLGLLARGTSYHRTKNSVSRCLGAKKFKTTCVKTNIMTPHADTAPLR